MKAIVASGPKEIAIREVAEPQPRWNEALVRVAAFSLNRGELRAVSNAKEGARPGWDVAGVVEQQAADGSGPAAGARVVGILESGGWCERVAIRSDHLAVLPDGVSFTDAATLPVAGLTALRAVELGGSLLGKRVLVTGAAGGVGRFAIQLARRAGAHITAVVGRPERGEGLRELGADEIVTAVDRSGRPFDHILESVGGRSLETSLAVIAPGGMIVVYGNSSSEPAALDARAFFNKVRATIRALMVFDEIEHESFAVRGLGLLASLVASGHLRTEVTCIHSWREIDDALADLEGRRVTGKVVMTVDGSRD